jgi:hypothetical protein
MKWWNGCFQVLNPFCDAAVVKSIKSTCYVTALQRESHLCIPKKELRAVLISTFTVTVSVSDLYIPRIGPHMYCIILRAEWCWPIVEIILYVYKSLPDTWMWKLGLRPRNSFSGNIFIEFSVLCSLQWAPSTIGINLWFTCIIFWIRNLF